MADDFLISYGDVSSSKNDEEKDLKEVHILRGRFLHWVSIIERIMKEYCKEINSHKTYGQMKDPFVNKLTENKLNDTSGFYDFVKALNEINPDRNSWAHGFIFYSSRENKRPNNFINLNNKLTSIQPPYFNDISKYFSIVIGWLKQNDLWKISTYDLSQFDEK
mgnify:FL=1